MRKNAKQSRHVLSYNQKNQRRFGKLKSLLVFMAWMFEFTPE